jgi:hypothetical protein
MSGEVKSKVVIKNGKTKTCGVVQIDGKNGIPTWKLQPRLESLCEGESVLTAHIKGDKVNHTDKYQKESGEVRKIELSRDFTCEKVSFGRW